MALARLNSVTDCLLRHGKTFVSQHPTKFSRIAGIICLETAALKIHDLFFGRKKDTVKNLFNAATWAYLALNPFRFAPFLGAACATLRGDAPAPVFVVMTCVASYYYF